jgi:predicted anti-sigma-YlaC factor YlaD
MQNNASLPAHPTELWLARFASNEVGIQRRKEVSLHLETCQDCRKIVSRHRELARRYRDLERRAIFNPTNA